MDVHIVSDLNISSRLTDQLAILADRSSFRDGKDGELVGKGDGLSEGDSAPLLA
jgi:hypothetical protein